MRGWVIVLLLSTAHAAPTSARAPASAPAPTSARAPASAPAPARTPVRRTTPSSAPAARPPSQDLDEYRFDALRIDGALHGPEAVIVRSDLTRDQRSLTRLRRSFVHRVLEAMEAPGLHGGR
jgi:hypothetical protein